jgi:serine/threonine protein kinase
MRSGHSSISWTRGAGLISDQDNPDNNDLQVELYSLGITLYEMLTGTLPSVAADPLEWRVTSASSMGARRPRASLGRQALSAFRQA